MSAGQRIVINVCYSWVFHQFISGHCDVLEGIMTFYTCFSVFSLRSSHSEETEHTIAAGEGQRRSLLFLHNMEFTDRVWVGADPLVRKT